MHKKIRVLHVVGKMNRGGLETFIMNVYRKIPLDQIQFDFIVTKKGEGDFDKEIKELGGNIYILPTPKANFIKYLMEFTKILRKNHYQIIHSHVYYNTGINLFIAKMNGVNIRIAHSHNTKDGKKDCIMRNVYRCLMRKLILKNATHFFACGKEAGEALYGKKMTNKFKVIKNGIDLEKFSNIAKSKEECRIELGLPVDAYIIGNIARFSTQKNHKKLIEIFNYILKKEKNAYLIMVGSGKLQDDVKRMVYELGIEKRVKFLGIRKDIPEILKALDLFLLPSLYEGLPVVLIEAQASNIRCLVSDSVSVEVKLTNNIEFIPLDSKLEEWYLKLRDTSEHKSINTLHLYDINYITKYLIDIYKRAIIKDEYEV